MKHLREVPDELQTTDIISWAGFQCQNVVEVEVPPKAIIGLLPPFEEKSGSVAMCKHSMMKMVEITEFCNPGQTPVGGCDIPPLHNMQAESMEMEDRDRRR